MRTVPNENKPEHKPRYTGVPIEIFCRMRQAIGEVFVENGEPEVQQQLGDPPSLPDWLNKGFNNFLFKLMFKYFLF